MSLFACCNCDPAAEEETQLQPSDEDNNDTNDALPLTPEQKLREKERLQALVKAFAKAAVVGASCHFIDIGARRRIPASYVLDKALKTFTVAFGNGIEHSFPLTALQEVYSYDSLLRSENTAFLAEEPGIGDLEADAKSRLLMLEYLDPAGAHLNRLFLMESGGPEMRDRFVTCMKILRLYALAGPSASNG